MTSAAVRPWLEPFPLLVGLMTLGLCAYLAAVYMTVETDGELREDFRRRALAAGLCVGIAALPAAWVAVDAAPVLGRPLLTSAWSLPFHLATGAVAVAALATLATRRYRAARGLAVMQATLIPLGWGMAQYPLVLAPDLPIDVCSAPRAVLASTLTVLGIGTAVLVPAFVWLYRVFKSAAPAAPTPSPPPTGTRR